MTNKKAQFILALMIKLRGGAFPLWLGYMALLAVPEVCLSAPVAKVAPASASTSHLPALRIISDQTLGEDLKYAVDVRWAGDNAVALALKRSGVVEYSLDGKAAPRQLIPGEKAAGGFWLSQHLAVSSRYLVAGAPLFAITWRSVDSAERKEEAFEGIDDVDLHGDRIAVVGARRDAIGQFSPDGAIAWTGSLDHHLEDLKPLLFDAGGPGAPSMNACGVILLGVTRFLADGSFWIVPGVQPGVYHFDPQGKLVQTLDTVALGVDTDCAGIDKELAATLARNFPRRLAWVNARRIVDDVLPLPSGPGLLIRSFQQGQVRWVLKIPHSDGSVTIYDVPMHAHTPFAHLKGDLRQGRLALLLWEYSQDGKPDGAPLPHLLLASLPSS